VAIATREGEFNALTNSQRLLGQKIETVVYEIQSLAAQEREGLEKRSALTASAEQSELRERDRQGRVAEWSARLETLRQQRDQSHTGLTESKVSLATEEQLCSSFEQQQQSLEQRLRELGQVVEKRRAEIASFLSRKEQAETEIEASRAAIGKLQHEREQVNAQAAELLGRKQAQESDISAREDGLRDRRRRLTELQQQRGSIDVELAQKEMTVQNL